MDVAAFTTAIKRLRAFPPSWHLFTDKTVDLGSAGDDVRLVQEWLSLNSLPVEIDGQFGPQTQAAASEFRRGQDMDPLGPVDSVVLSRLIETMLMALAPLSVPPVTLSEAITTIAGHHLEAAAREVGGTNRGPWVRLYMNGHDGQNLPWCAGFVCAVVQQACGETRNPAPIPLSRSCTQMARRARQLNMLETIESAVRQSSLPGSVYLIRSGKNRWSHCGIITDVRSDSIETIEGNTNSGGSAEGYAVCRRTRRRAGNDVILLPPPRHSGYGRSGVCCFR